MSKHTPGRWIVRHASYGRNGCVIMDELYVARDGDNMSIAADISDPETGEFSMANARLIAAAPDLLDALIAADTQMQMAYECLIDYRHDEAMLHLGAMSRIRKMAIAKAKGEQA